MSVIWLLGGVVLTAILLKIVSSVLPDIEMDGMGPAFVAALIASVAGFVAQLAISLAPSYLPAEGWMVFAIGPALSSATLAIGIALSPGIRAGLMSTLAAAVIVSVASSGLIFVISPLLARGLTL